MVKPVCFFYWKKAKQRSPRLMSHQPEFMKESATSWIVASSAATEEPAPSIAVLSGGWVGEGCPGERAAGSAAAQAQRERPRLLLPSHCPAHHFLLLGSPNELPTSALAFSISPSRKQRALGRVSSSLICFILFLQCFVLGWFVVVLFSPKSKILPTSHCHTLK